MSDDLAVMSKSEAAEQEEGKLFGQQLAATLFPNGMTVDEADKVTRVHATDTPDKGERSISAKDVAYLNVPGELCATLLAAGRAASAAQRVINPEMDGPLETAITPEMDKKIRSALTAAP